MPSQTYAALCLAVLIGACPARADIALGQYGSLTGDMRARYEFVDQDKFDRDAEAATARLRLGYRTPVFGGLSGYVEGEGVTHLGGGLFSNAAHRDPRYPAVNDPDDLAVHQLYADYARPDAFDARVGRQAIAYDDQRFIGPSAFRQTDRTFDAVSVNTGPFQNLALSYNYVWQVNQTLGSRVPGGGDNGHLHFLHAHYDLPQAIGVSTFAYLLDFDAGREIASSQTYGVRAAWEPKGDGWQPVARGSVATQSDYESSPLHYTEPYYSAELGAAHEAWSLTGGVEVLGGNGRDAVQEPAGTKHPFNGWAEKFAVTPAAGLVDVSARAHVPLVGFAPGRALAGIMEAHYFQSDRGGRRYGSEGDAGLTYTLNKNNDLNLQLARYQANGFSTDTTKIWVYYGFRF